MFNLAHVRRWPWLVLGGVGVGIAVFPWLTRVAARYFGADLATRDQLSSVYSLGIGFISLIVAVIGLMRQSRIAQRTSEGPSAYPPFPVPGMTSLTVPDLVSKNLVLGRDVLLKELTGFPAWHFWNSPRTARVHVLHGMGGSGKTAVAVLAARQASHRGFSVWWVSAATKTDLHTGMRQLATQLGASPWELEQEWADNAPDALWRRLATHRSRWLLIIDNADEPTMLAPSGEPVSAGRGWIRPTVGSRGAIIVTSRDGEAETWGPWCQRHAVGMLSNADGAHLLLSHIGARAGTLEEATALAARLGGLPLALTLAARFLADQARVPVMGSIKTFAEYRRILDAEGVGKVFGYPTRSFGPSNARQTIDRTWELSLDTLDRRGLPQARYLLRLLATLADSPIPYRLLLDAALMACSPLFPGLDPPRLAILLQGLANLGLVNLHDSGNNAGPEDVRLPTDTLQLHPLIRDASRHHLHGSSQEFPTLTLAARLLNSVVSDGFLKSAEDPIEWPAWRLFAPHAFHLVTLVRQNAHADTSATEDAIAAAQRATRFLGALRLYNNAIAELQSLLLASEESLGAAHPLTLLVRTDLAWWTGHAGRPDAALTELREILPLRERASGKQHPDTLTVRADLAEWTGRANPRDAAKARDLYAEILPVREVVSGPDGVDTLLARARLANWTGLAGDAALARDMLRELVPVRERVSGPEHVDTLNTRRKAAEWAGEAGDATGAREELRVLLTICQRQLGHEHPDTLEVHVRLARWTGRAGDWPSAHAQLTQIADAYRSTFGAGSLKATELQELLLQSSRATIVDQK